MRRELAVLLRDASLLALNKPSGLAVHHGLDRSGDNVVSRLAEIGLAGAAPVHRLDRPTSGVLVCAMTRDVAIALGRAFAEGRVRKTYVALVRGEAPLHELVDHPVPKDEGGPRVPARTAVTRIATVTLRDSPLREQRYSFVRAAPETGRFHQIRRHLKHLGNPIVGDSTYGRSEHNRYFAARFGLARLALHAEAIALEHPEDGREVEIHAELPPDLEEALRASGLAAI